MTTYEEIAERTRKYHERRAIEEYKFFLAFLKEPDKFLTLAVEALKRKGVIS